VEERVEVSCPTAYNHQLTQFYLYYVESGSKKQKKSKNFDSSSDKIEKQPDVVESVASSADKIPVSLSFIVDDTVFNDEPSTVAVSEDKLQELGLLDGDIVLLSAKRKKKTLAVIVADKNIGGEKIRMSKLHKSNLR
jgi:hypothetical protein